MTVNNQRTAQLIKKYNPTIAIVVYEAEGKESYSDDYYLESHRIEDGKIMEGKPLLQETLNGIVDVFFDDRKNRTNISGFIPENLLSFETLLGGKYEMTWYRPEETRHIYFKEDLHLPSGKTWVPALIYKVNGNSLDVFALKSNERPNEHTKLYVPPFHNVDNNGSVCLGSAKVKKPTENTYLNIMKYWEDMFWNSEFTHLAGRENPTKSNLNTLWKRLVQSNTKLKWSNLIDELKPLKTRTVKDLL